MTNLEQAHLVHSQAAVRLEIAQAQYNEAKKKLVEELNKRPEPVADLGKKEEAK